MTNAYCPRCKKKREVVNPKIKEVVSSTRGKTRFCIGNCIKCGNKISVIMSKEIKEIKIPERTTENFEDKKLQNLQERIDERKEFLQAQNYKEEINSDEFLKRNNVKAVNSNWYNLFKTTAIMFFLLILGIAIFTGWMVMNGKLDSIIQPISNIYPNFNFSNVFNNQFDNTVNNDYQNNFTIINNVKVCTGNVTC